MADQATIADHVAPSDESAMSDPDARMVLRTVYLPPNLDDELRVRAFHLNQSKNDLIREAVTRWLSEGSVSASVPAKGKAARRSAPRRRTASRKGAADKA